MPSLTISKFTSNNIQSYFCVGHTHTTTHTITGWHLGNDVNVLQLMAWQHPWHEIMRRLQFGTRRSKKLIATHVKMPKCWAQKYAMPKIWITLTGVHTYIRADMQMPIPHPHPHPHPHRRSFTVSNKCLRVCDKFRWHWVWVVSQKVESTGGDFWNWRRQHLFYSVYKTSTYLCVAVR